MKKLICLYRETFGNPEEFDAILADLGIYDGRDHVTIEGELYNPPARMLYYKVGVLSGIVMEKQHFSDLEYDTAARLTSGALYEWVPAADVKVAMLPESGQEYIIKS